MVLNENIQPTHEISPSHDPLDMLEGPFAIFQNKHETSRQKNAGDLLPTFLNVIISKVLTIVGSFLKITGNGSLFFTL